MRLPANSLSREPCPSVCFCSAVDPIPLKAYCAANLFRFAQSEKDYLFELTCKVRKLAGENLVLEDCCPSWWKWVHLPDGGLAEPPILQGLLDAIHQEGSFSWIRALHPIVSPHGSPLSMDPRRGPTLAMLASKDCKGLPFRVFPASKGAGTSVLNFRRNGSSLWTNLCCLIFLYLGLMASPVCWTWHLSFIECVGSRPLLVPGAPQFVCTLMKEEVVVLAASIPGMS